MGALSWVISVISNLFSFMFVLLLVVIVLVISWLRRRGREEPESDNSSVVPIEDDDSGHCLYGLPASHRHCPNCDLVEQCLGISFDDQAENL